MKKIKNQLKTIANSLASLSVKVEKIMQQVDKLPSGKPASAAKKKAPAKKAPAKKAPKKKAPAKKAVAKKTAPAKQLTMLETVFNCIKRTKKGISFAQLKEKTNLNTKQLSNALYKLSKKGKIEPRERGLYVKK